MRSLPHQFISFVSKKCPVVFSWSVRTIKVHLAVPLFLAVLVIVSYGLKIKESGFYWDGWAFIQSLNRLGPDQFVKILGINRPFTALLYAFTTRVFKDIPIRWQAFGLLCRWVSGVSLWWTLRELWRLFSIRKCYQVYWIAALFVVYPSFTQQAISVVYSHIFFNFSIFIFSLGAMFRAMRTKRKYWWLVSWLSSSYILFALEYYVGLELIRPALLWFFYFDQGATPRKSAQKAVVSWSPFLILFIAYIVWRFYLIPPSMYEVGIKEQLLHEPLEALISLIGTIISDLLEVSLIVWDRTVELAYILLELSEQAMIYKLVVLGVSLITFLFFWKFTDGQSGDSEDEPPEKVTWYKHPIFLGTLFMLFAGLPYWSVPLPIGLEFSENRHTIPMMIGASLVFVGVVEWLIQHKKGARVVIALLIGFASGYHYQVANSFSLEYKLQKDFVWQFLWRVPYLEPGTMILGDGFPFPFSDDEAVTAMINLAYREENITSEVPYGFFFLEGALGNEIQGLSPGVDVEKKYGPQIFSGSTSQMIVVYFSGNDCLRILYPPDDDLGQVYPGLLSEVVQQSDITNIKEIEGSIDLVRLERYFGMEPPNTWCYYYQKAELARQYKQWKRVAKIGDLIVQRGIEVNAPEELFPFIEGYANVGDFEKAKQLTFDALDATRTVRPVLCAIWERIPASVLKEGVDSSTYSEVLDKLECDWEQ